MDGVQKTVVLGLRYLANKVEEGVYEVDDNAFGTESTMKAFLEDLEDEVIGKTE